MGHTSNIDNEVNLNAHALFNALPQATALIDAAGCIAQVNSAFIELFGTAIAKVPLNSLFECSNDYQHFIESAIVSAVPASAVLWLKQSTGNKVKVVAQLSSYPCKNITHMLSLYAFTENGLGAHFIAGISDDGCWAWDLVKSTTWRSPRWLELGERTHEPAMRDSVEISNLFEFINASEDRDALQPKMMDDKNVVEGEGYLKFPDGRRKHMSWQGLVVARNALGEPILSMGSIRDMTTFVNRNTNISMAKESVAHQARLLQLGETLAAVSHELNQPLAAIASFASVCKRNLIADSENNKLVAKIEAQALRAGTLLRRIREFAHRGNGLSVAINIRPVLIDAIDWMNTDWRCRDMKFYLTINPQLADKDFWVKCERVELEQIIINLIVNAAAAVASMAGGGAKNIDSQDLNIIVEPNIDSTIININVADRGPGISIDLQKTIFTPFVSSRPDGLGLGLSISRSIAEELNGTLKYQPREGGGAIFILSLPIASECIRG